MCFNRKSSTRNMHHRRTTEHTKNITKNFNGRRNGRAEIHAFYGDYRLNRRKTNVTIEKTRFAADKSDATE